MEKRESANSVNGYVGVVGCAIVEGMGGVGNVPIHARIVVTSARVKIVVLGENREIVEREQKPVQECQHNDNANVKH